MEKTPFAQAIFECDYYLDQGLSIIPVRDKPQTYNNREFTAKSAYPWAKWQREIISKAEIYHLMVDHFKTVGFGIVGGKVSGNLEIIDIDTKNWPGIDVKLFQDIKAFLPHIFDKLRIHQSPSGGYHVFYKVDGHDVPGNKKLAYQEEAKEAALETRGEGGYVVASTQMGYKVVQNRPIPIITWEERCSIITICEGYNQKIKIKKEYQSKADIDYYDENPFDHFNNSPAAEKVLTDNGWTFEGDSNNFIWFTKPNSKKGGVHASFNKSKKVYYIFTSGTVFEPATGYNPSTALSILQHNGDKKVTFQFLRNNKYGKIKPEKEEAFVKKAVLSKKPLPANFSDAAVNLHAAISKQMQQLHPYGTFWAEEPEKGIVIDRERLYIVANGLGFRLFNKEILVQVIDNIIYERDTRFFFDAIKLYIKEEDELLYFSICNSYESFIERHGKFSISRLKILHEDSLLLDTRTSCYKFYKNGMVHITSAGFSLQPFPTDKFIWNKSIQPRDFYEYEGGLYVDYLDKAIGISDYLVACIGYLAHEYKDDTAGYIIILSEQCEDSKDGGGSGKNIFSNLFAHTTTYFTKAGSQIKYDEKFMQAWNFEKIFAIADALKNFSFEFLKEFTTGSATMKKLHVNEYSISSSDMPKFLISTNYSYEIKDGGIKRRARPIEFTDFFTKSEGVNTYYEGVHFPNDWTKDDWGGYDTTIAIGVQAWLIANRKLPAPPLSDGGWKKQFQQTHGIVSSSIINENINEWIDEGFISKESFDHACNTYYAENNTPAKYRPSMRSFNEAIADHCQRVGVIFKQSDQKKINSIVTSGKSFKK